MLQQHADRVNVKPTEDNPLMTAIFSSDMDEGSFLELLRSNRSARTEDWKRYRRSLSRLTLRKSAETEENVMLSA
jgi:hypothetical protein